MSSKIFVSEHSTDSDWRKAVKNLGAKVTKALKGNSCDFMVFFVSEDYEEFAPKEFCEAVMQHFSPKILIGCNASGIIGKNIEVETKPGLSVIAMHLPGVKVNPFWITSDESMSLKDPNQLISELDIYPTDRPHFILLADPGSCDISRLLGGFNEAYKGLPVIGGLASGQILGKENWLCLMDEVIREGAVGVALTGDIEFETIVSQGCRPIAKPFVVTKADSNCLQELAGRSPLEVLREIVESLPAKDKELAENSLLVGLAMMEKKDVFKRGDFLIRNIIGFNPEDGTLMVGADLRVGQTLQFQLRDAETSGEDLKALLEKNPATKNGGPKGAILVSCCGRGQNLYGEENHDIRLIQDLKGPLPLSGFFASGEIGPVGGRNFVHGYTSSLVILK